MSFIVALLGAESTGKTTLSGDIAAALRSDGHEVAIVKEYLREFCEATGRTPVVEEQRAIAAEQTRRIADAAATHDIVVADTTALMIAVYSDFVFADRSLYDAATADHAKVDLTLLAAIDIPWQADGLQREGPHVQGPVDALIRAALALGHLDYSIVGGQGGSRLQAALGAIRHAMRPLVETPRPRWQWHCERCGDTACERHSLRLS